ncbi:MAG: GntR family transcriptional regulator [Clostridia bacterium]|nr:GntR family transcriptional regulator [Clostridia bacterium]
MIITPKLEHEHNREYALRIVRDNIINLEIKPGSLIGEQEIASMLGLSRTPVHEAFLELSKSKIINILPQKGCLVSYIDPELIKEARFLRRCVESALIEEVIDVATPEDLIEIDENIRLQEFYKDNSDKLMELDNNYHKIMYRICNKMQCHYMVTLMSMHFDRVRNLSLHAKKDAVIIDDHRKIYEAIVAKDKKTAVSIFEKHISRIDLDWSIIEDNYSEYIVK